MTHAEFHASVDELLALAGLPLLPSGAVQIRGPSDPLLQTRYRIAQAGVASFGATGAAAALLWALKTGRRQEISVDSEEAVVGLRSNAFVRIDGAVPPRERDPMGGFYQLGNGRWFMLHCSLLHLRDGAARALGVPPTREASAAAFKAWAGDPEKLETAIFEAGGCGAYVRTPDEWNRTAQAVALKNVPLLDVVKIGDAPPEPLPAGDKPLSGIRVLDLTRVIAGPSGARLLAEYGADVLRVTRADLPDVGTPIDTGLGKQATFLDLRDNEQNAKLRDLARTADIFVQSYRPGALAQHGYSPEALAKIRPGAVYVTLNAWGHGGPWQFRRGYDTVVQAASGMAHTHASNGTPVLQTVAVLDYVSGALVAFGAMAALYRRATEGGSWLVRTSLAGAMQWLCSMGLLTEAERSTAPATFEKSAVDRLYAQMPSPLGLLDYLRLPVHLSETPPFASYPPVPLGSSEPVWREPSGATGLPS